MAANANAYTGPANITQGSIPVSAPAFNSPEWNEDVLKRIEKAMKK